MIPGFEPLTLNFPSTHPTRGVGGGWGVRLTTYYAVQKPMGLQKTYGVRPNSQSENLKIRGFDPSRFLFLKG